MFPYLPQKSRCNKRLRAALPLVKRMIRELALDSEFRTETVWITESTPVRAACRARPSSAPTWRATHIDKSFASSKTFEKDLAQRVLQWTLKIRRRGPG